MNLLTGQIAILISQLMVVSFVLYLIDQKQRPTSMLAWVFAILLVPYIAVPFFFLFGIRKRHKKWEKPLFRPQNIQQKPIQKAKPLSDLLSNLGVPEPTSNNAVSLYTDGIEAYNALFHAIKNAHCSIYLATYVFQKDTLTESLLDLLTQKAEQGIEVKVLIDALGSLKVYTYQRYFKALRQAGGEVHFFMPIFQMPFRNYINYRNHRKIYLIDQATVFSGGMNLGNEYLGPRPCSKRWNDILFRIDGEAVCHFYNIFISDWRYATHESIQPMRHVTNYCPTIPPSEQTTLQIVPSGPDIPNDALYDSLLYAMYTSKQRIWIVTPYFVPSESLMEALAIMAQKGIDIKIITPENTNHKLVGIARRSFMRQLEKNGVDIVFCRQMIHAKAILFDDDAVMLGSVNLDSRSLFLNYEIAAYAYDKNVITPIADWMNTLLDHAKYGLSEPTKGQLFRESIVKCIVPLL